MKNRISYILLLLVALFSASACDSKKETPEAPTNVADLVIEMGDVVVQLGKVLEIPVKAGSGDYFVAIPEIGIASAKVTNNSILLKGIREGETTLTVTDNISKQAKTLKVTVSKEPVLMVSHREINIDTGSTMVVSVFNGSGEYKVEVSNPELATFYTSENNIVFSAKKIGKGTATITDTKQGISKTLNLEVSPIALVLSTYELTVQMNDTHKISVVRGSGNYTATCDKPELAEINVKKGNITIQAKAVGEGTITIKDNVTQDTKTVKLITKLQPLKTSHDDWTSITLTMSMPQSIEILRGNGSYTLKSDEEGVFTAKLEGSKVVLTPVAKGESKLTITDNLSKEVFSISVEVQEIPTLITFDVDKVEVSVGKYLSIHIKDNKSGDAYADFVSGDTSIATVWNYWTGEISVKGVKPGKTVLIAKDRYSNTIYGIIPIEVK